MTPGTTVPHRLYGQRESPAIGHLPPGCYTLKRAVRAPSLTRELSGLTLTRNQPHAQYYLGTPNLNNPLNVTLATRDTEAGCGTNFLNCPRQLAANKAPCHPRAIGSPKLLGAAAFVH